MRARPLAVAGAWIGLAALVGCPDEAAGPGAGGVELVSADGSSVDLSHAELRAMSATEGYGGMYTSIGDVRSHGRYRGVALSDLLELVGGLGDGEGLRVVASDGYSVTLSRDQAASGAFAAYDRSSGDPLQQQVELTAVLAYDVDGSPLEGEAGPYRLVIVGEDPDIVSDAFFWVRGVARLEVQDLGGEWSLLLDGAISEEVSRASFETCAACHAGSWTDERGREWSGVPLWLLIGKVDDENGHDGQAFDRVLAGAPYDVVLRNEAGAEVRLASDRVALDDDVVLAHRVAAVPLDGDDFPLRLVGPELTDEERLGAVAAVVLDLP